MMRANTAVAAVRDDARSVATTRTVVAPPSLSLLPRRVQKRGFFASTLLHAALVPALIWLPRFIPDSPVILPAHLNKPEVAEALPVELPKLPTLANSGSTGGPAPNGRTSAIHARPADPPLEEPDFVSAQQVVSVVPNPVNRVQTILRPDLVRPPEMKFPMRLQSMVSLPAAAPVLQPPPQKEPNPPSAVAQAAEDVPVIKRTSESTVVTLTPQRSSLAQPKAAPAPAVAPNFKALAKVESKALKSIVVVNAVDVAPDSAVPLPDAQLAGLFVVGPSPDSATAAKSLVAGNDRAPVASPISGSESSARSTPETGKSGDSAGDRGLAGSGTSVAGVSIGSGPSNAAPPGSGGGLGKGGAGTGIGPGGAAGSGSGPGHAASNGPSGISISGGVPGRGGASIAKAAPVNRSYGMMIISSGSSGGASRDVGVFDRSETVYSVTISMAEAGGGPDWTLQYALAAHAQTPGLLVPPLIQKKVGATMTRSLLPAASGLVFLTGTIDENGRLQSLRVIRPQDPRSDAARRALEQWQFLPAQLDGKPVASKILIGAAVIGSE